MPIFHDPQESPLAPAPNPQVLASGQSRAGTPNISPERPLLDSLLSQDATSAVTYRTMEPDSPNQGRKLSGVDRLELIERLKRVQSPPRHLQQSNDLQRDARPESPLHRIRPKTPLPHSNDVKVSRTTTPELARDTAAIGLAIERPRSALHSGDFRVDKGRDSPDHGSSSTFLATSPVVPWNQSFPVAALPAQRNEPPFNFKFGPSEEARAVSRARAISQSSMTSFALLPPTSPLVHQANNTDLDFSSRPTSRQNSRSPERNNRRHTFSPSSFQSYSATQMARSTSGTPAARHIRYGSSIPYQAHQPRRSITSLSQSQSNPPTPHLGSRRPSISSEASPLQHAPMVGSYEESILRGRMSTVPSRPLDFVAKIGVLGKGQCKASLKCPPHVTVPFPAVFYSYNTGNGRISDNEPSPYVGLIDLENSLPPPVENDNGKRKRRHAVPSPDREDFDFRIAGEPDFRKQEKRKRRSTSPKAPSGGCYRIPAQGQLQVVLKNPNKTAVKLFLVPYDLSDMEPGQKTFIRQRSYSAGPIIDMPTSSRKNFGTDRPEAALSNSDDPNDRPILRYLIHLHICCPSKGRYYLYKSIRVVFANRVPDGKEKLRNEIQLPEPKYSAYKPSREQGPSSITAQLNAEKALRRRSAGWPLSHSQRSYDQIDGLTQHRQPLPPPALQFTGGPLIPSSASSGFSSPMPDLQPIPFSFNRLAAIESRPVSREQMDIDPTSPFRTPVASPKSAMGNSPLNSETATTFEKRSPGEAGYGGVAFSPLGSPGAMPSAGLLSRRLRGLDVQREEEP